MPEADVIHLIAIAVQGRDRLCSLVGQPRSILANFSLVSKLRPSALFSASWSPYYSRINENDLVAQA
jgi:hypothetical protein